MARPVSWLPRLHEIRKSVANSVRSHYTREEIEHLFQLQPRAAARLMELLPIEPIGTTYTVSRESLGALLDRFQEADDAHRLLAQLRTEKAGRSRRKIRHLVRRDVAPATLGSLPTNVTVERGLLQVRFDTLVQLGEAMLWLALVLESDGDEFARQYEPRPPEVEDDLAADMKVLWEELDEMRAANGQR